MPSAIGLALAAAGAATVPPQWVRIDLTTGVHIDIPAGQPLPDIPGAIGSDGGNPLPPDAMAGKSSGFTPIARARDTLDPARWPARAVAKLFRLDAAGARTGNACTAQFVGPRHLVTAAHCVVDRTSGKPFSGLEVAVRFDNGRAGGGTARATAAFMPGDRAAPATPASAMVTPDLCDDVAVVEITAPLGRATGWLGLRAATTTGALRRFSYPQQSAAVPLLAVRDRPDTPAIVRAAIDAEIAKVRAREPAFSPDDLYLDQGTPIQTEASFLAEPSTQSIPGRSGSAMLDGDGAILALMSRSYGGMTYSCRLDPKAIGMIANIIRR